MSGASDANVSTNESSPALSLVGHSRWLAAFGKPNHERGTSTRCEIFARPSVSKYSDPLRSTIDHAAPMARRGPGSVSIGFIPFTTSQHEAR